LTIWFQISKMAANMNFLDETPETVPPKRRFTQTAWFPWLVVLSIFVLLLVIFSPVVFIRSGHRGIATFFGDTQGDVLGEGAHLKYPLLRVHQFDTRTQTREVATGVVTEDMQLVTVGVTLSYRLDTAELRDIFEDVGKEVEAKIIDPAVKEAVNVAATAFTAEELISDRDDFKTSVLAEVELALAESGVIVEKVAITEVSFSKTLQEAFESKTTAEQEAEAAALRAQAAESNTEAEVGLSEAEAKRIQTIGEALRGNEAYIQYEIMMKWDGKSPLYLAPSSPVQIVNDRE
jgi:regulator of protease activity HflC (stomatin/prohibitin superfamily)